MAGGWGDVLRQWNIPRPQQARYDGMRRTGAGRNGGGVRGGGQNNQPNRGGGNNGGGGGGTSGNGNGGGGGRAPGFYTVSTTTPAPTGQEALAAQNIGTGGFNEGVWSTMQPQAGVTAQQLATLPAFANLNNAQQQQLGGLQSGYIPDVNDGDNIPLSLAPNSFIQDSSQGGLSNWQAVLGALENWKPVTVTQEFGTPPAATRPGIDRRPGRNRR